MIATTNYFVILSLIGSSFCSSFGSRPGKGRAGILQTLQFLEHELSLGKSAFCCCSYQPVIMSFSFIFFIVWRNMAGNPGIFNPAGDLRLDQFFIFWRHKARTVPKTTTHGNDRKIMMESR